MKKKRLDFLPAIGQALISGMCAEAVSAAKKGRGSPSYCPAQLFDMANIPLDFQARWSSERAIQDALVKARDYGFVRKTCGNHWQYTGPEVEEARKAFNKKCDEAKKKALSYLKTKGLVAKADGIYIEEFGPQRGKVTARVTLPKSLWLK